MTLPKQIVAEVYDPTGANLLAVWRDIAPPSWTYDERGLSDITLTVARPFGDADMPGDRVSSGALDFGNRVVLRVQNVDLGGTPLPGAEMLAGRFIPGRAVEGGEGTGTVVWQGTIERWTGPLPILATIDCMSGSRIARQTQMLANDLGAWQILYPVPTSNSLASRRDADPVRVARALVYDAGTALTWDITNPDDAGRLPLPALHIPAGSLAEQLDALRRLAGAYWHAYVTPRLTVRMFASDPTTDTPDHDLVAGVHCGMPALTMDGSAIVRRASVTYFSAQHNGDVPANATSNFVASLNGGFPWYVSRTAPEYTPLDPRHVLVRDDNVNGSRMGALRARAILEANARPIPRGSVVVPDVRHPTPWATSGYDIDSFAPGQTVRITYEQPLTDSPPMLAGRFVPGRSREALAGYGETLVIAQIENRLTECTLHFGQVVPNTAGELDRFDHELDLLRRTH
jgi:hypothetical protein